MQALAVISALVFAAFAFLLWRLRMLRLALRLPEPPAASGTDSRVTAVIAARDEEHAIVSSLRSVLADPAVSSVILVDDRSVDATAELARSLAEREPRLQVISSPDLPDGWVGKSHALHHGAKSAETEYVLFADADVAVTPGSVTAATKMMDERHLDHLSGFFKIECMSAGEKACAPVFIWAATLTLFADAPVHGAATGAFNMIRTTTYRAMGGHERFKGSVVDDVSLARTAKQEGANSAFLDLSGAVRVRLFEGFAGFFRAIARSSQSYLGDRFLLALGAGFGLIAFGAAMILCPVFACWALSRGFENAGVWPIAGASLAAGGYLMASACAREIRRYHNARAAWAMFVPVVIVLMGAAIIWSALRKLTGTQVRWRGRAYPVK